MKISVVRDVLDANDQVALENRALLDAAGVLGMNLMASPGAGKTSLILATARYLKVQMGVIEGDLASRIDADTIAANGIPVTQINTGGSCHLDAPMLRPALAELPLDTMALLFVENVGNLVCTANFALGTHVNVVVASTPEGHDKPYKYPGMFAAADVVVLNKADLLEVFEFNVPFFRQGIAQVNPHAPLFVVSSKTGAGIAEWANWIMEQVTNNS